jgi:predicted RNA-binding Zn-ribbon protein involved in translation (DUF1610 family)
MNKEIQEIKRQLDRIEAIISEKPESAISTNIDLNKRCSCGALMILTDNNPRCQGYKCPQCGNMEFASTNL